MEVTFSKSGGDPVYDDGGEDGGDDASDDDDSQYDGCWQVG